MTLLGVWKRMLKVTQGMMKSSDFLLSTGKGGSHFGNFHWDGDGVIIFGGYGLCLIWSVDFY